MKVPIIEGRILCLRSGFYTVQIESPQSAYDRQTVVCQARGRLKRHPGDEDLFALGDRVSVLIHAEGKGMIESILERRNALIRRESTSRGSRQSDVEYKQILVSNIDQLVLVFACEQPPPRLPMLDRFLVIAEKQNIPAWIVVNKVDLIGVEAAQAMFEMYPPLGYPVLLTSTVNRLGLETLREGLTGKISALVGPSGVGKTSLLNLLQPGLGLKVRQINMVRDRGRHTTVTRQMFALDGGGYLADLPGLRSLALWDTQPEELDGYFPELRPLVSQCQYNDCTHQNESGCAVIEAVNAGTVHPLRYQSYLKLRFGEEQEAAE